MYVVASRHSSAVRFSAYDIAYNAVLEQATTYKNRVKANAVPASLVVTFKDSNVFVSVVNKANDKLLNWWVLAKQY